MGLTGLGEDTVDSTMDTDSTESVTSSLCYLTDLNGNCYRICLDDAGAAGTPVLYSAGTCPVVDTSTADSTGSTAGISTSDTACAANTGIWEQYTDTKTGKCYTTCGSYSIQVDCNAYVWIEYAVMGVVGIIAVALIMSAAKQGR
jgi:hypothetical protein